MKQTLLVAIASAAIGAATAVILTDERPPPARGTAPTERIDVAALEAAFVRALRSVRPERPVVEPAPAPAPRAAATPAVEARAETILVRPAKDSAPLPPANEAELQQVERFDRAPASARRWLFRSEDEVLARFGTPSQVVMNGAAERWIYILAEGKQRFFDFHRGRLITIW
jgi:hypothetical protein